MSHPASRNENAVRAVLAFETCAGAVVGREWPSCGGGVGRASAVSELTERVRFFFSITNLELSIISIKLKRFFVIDRAARKYCDGHWIVLCTL